VSDAPDFVVSAVVILARYGNLWDLVEPIASTD
jgi:hypothetical protein